MSLPSDFLVDLKSVAEAPAMKLIYMCGNCINNAHMSCQRGEGEEVGQCMCSESERTDCL